MFLIIAFVIFNGRDFFVIYYLDFVLNNLLLGKYNYIELRIFKR